MASKEEITRVQLNRITRAGMKIISRSRPVEDVFVAYMPKSGHDKAFIDVGNNAHQVFLQYDSSMQQDLGIKLVKFTMTPFKPSLSLEENGTICDYTFFNEIRFLEGYAREFIMNNSYKFKFDEAKGFFVACKHKTTT